MNLTGARWRSVGIAQVITGILTMDGLRLPVSKVDAVSCFERPAAGLLRAARPGLETP